MVLGKMDIHMQNNEVGPLSNTIYKNYLKMDVRPKIKLLKENMEKSFMTLDLVITSWIDTKGTENKRENRQIGLHEKFKILCTKDIINRVKW